MCVDVFHRGWFLHVVSPPCTGHPRADHRGGAASSGPEESREDQETLQPEQGARGRRGVGDVLANWPQVHDLCDFVANI